LDQGVFRGEGESETMSISEEKRKQHHREMHQRAKELRQSQTPAEKKLWEILRNRKLAGYKFRRQHPLGPFIVDFFCDEARLVVELDGGVHNRQLGYDKARERWLEENGYKVLRFGNEMIEKDKEGIEANILIACEEAADPKYIRSPSPLPQLLERGANHGFAWG
jgi:very-short-patch-repair endonuclease